MNAREKAEARWHRRDSCELIELLDRLGMPDSFRQMAMIAYEVERLEDLTPEQAREVTDRALAVTPAHADAIAREAFARAGYDWGGRGA